VIDADGGDISRPMARTAPHSIHDRDERGWREDSQKKKFTLTQMPDRACARRSRKMIDEGIAASAGEGRHD
jgi:hypothetical protein